MLFQKCILFHQKIDEFLTHLKNLDRTSGAPRTEVAKLTKSVGEQPSQCTMNLIKQLIDW